MAKIVMTRRGVLIIWVKSHTVLFKDRMIASHSSKLYVLTCPCSDTSYSYNLYYGAAHQGRLMRMLDNECTLQGRHCGVSIL